RFRQLPRLRFSPSGTFRLHAGRLREISRGGGKGNHAGGEAIAGRTAQEDERGHAASVGFGGGSAESPAVEAVQGSWRDGFAHAEHFQSPRRRSGPWLSAHADVAPAGPGESQRQSAGRL